MRIKELFTIPEGEKVTEKMFGRVLLSSISGILLCMVCLASTTWAWFSVSVENTDNKIVIATITPQVTIKHNDSAVASSNGSYELNEGEYLLEVTLGNDASKTDAFGSRSKPMYLVLTVVEANKTKSYFLHVDKADTLVSRKITVSAGTTAKVSFSVSWVEPATAEKIGDTGLVIGGAAASPTPESSEGSGSE